MAGLHIAHYLLGAAGKRSEHMNFAERTILVKPRAGRVHAR